MSQTGRVLILFRSYSPLSGVFLGLSYGFLQICQKFPSEKPKSGCAHRVELAGLGGLGEVPTKGDGLEVRRAEE